jgi:2-dehydro-3-deoxygalactonokinase
MAAMPAQFLSCDWGTSSFRLRLVSTATNEVIAEVQSSDGIKTLRAQDWPLWSRPDQFADVMRNKLDLLAEKRAFRSLPLIISGMASSTIGWKSLPYAKLPMSIDGSDFHIEHLEWEAPKSVARTLLISGAASDDDIMRGEECQVVGVFNRLPFKPLAENAVLVLPGTHSKHVFVERQKIVRFRTFMTGELFEVLSRHSILSASMHSNTTRLPARRPKEVSVESERSAGFSDGVKHVREHGLMQSLFKVRTRSVLGNMEDWENSGFLSGLLIGAEVTELVPSFDRPIIVAGELANLYSKALNICGKSDQIIADVDDATTFAHSLALSNFYS